MEGAGQENPVGMSAGTCAAHHTYRWPLVKFHRLSYTSGTITLWLYTTQSKLQRISEGSENTAWSSDKMAYEKHYWHMQDSTYGGKNTLAMSGVGYNRATAIQKIGLRVTDNSMKSQLSVQWWSKRETGREEQKQNKKYIMPLFKYIMCSSGYHS